MQITNAIYITHFCQTPLPHVCVWKAYLLVSRLLVFPLGMSFRQKNSKLRGSLRVGRIEVVAHPKCGNESLRALPYLCCLDFLLSAAILAYCQTY